MSRALVEYVAPWLIDNPDALEINEIEGERGELIIEVGVDPEDMGKLIGRNGRIIRALRVLARAAQTEEGRAATIEVVD